MARLWGLGLGARRVWCSGRVLGRWNRPGASWSVAILFGRRDGKIVQCDQQRIADVRKAFRYAVDALA